MKELERGDAKLKRLVVELSSEKQILKDVVSGILSVERRHCAVQHAREEYEVTERHACRSLGHWRRTQRCATIPRIDEDALTDAVIALASKHGRDGCRRITVLLAKRWLA
jgi:hypothetical protein